MSIIIGRTAAPAVVEAAGLRAAAGLGHAGPCDQMRADAAVTARLRGDEETARRLWGAAFGTDPLGWNAVCDAMDAIAVSG